VIALLIAPTEKIECGRGIGRLAPDEDEIRRSLADAEPIVGRGDPGIRERHEQQRQHHDFGTAI
jgi:hypothetical protein